MTISKDGWISWAIPRPGPPDKMYPEKNQSLGIVLHSVEGWLAGALGELMNPDRQASWHFTNAIDGRVYQHYPVFASCWASGNKTANTRYWAVESEGKAGTPLNAAQVANMVGLCEEFENFTTLKAQRSEPRTIWEHNEVATKWSPNAGPTSCPSGRYDGFYAELDKEEDSGVTKAEVEAMIKASEDKTFAAIARLNDAMITRMGIQATSLNPELEIVEQAADALRKAGFEI